MTPKIDCHLHTNFSPDGFNSPKEVINRAIDLGMQHICITDHVDFMYSDPTFKPFDTDEYVRTLKQLKEKYASKIYINVGVEVGYTKDNYLLNAQAIKKYNFDYVISSVHEVDGSDCYLPSHYANKPRDGVYTSYFQAVYESICAPYKPDAVGHLAYVSRCAPYPNKLLIAGEFDGILTKIFDKMIKNDIILELNTNVYAAGIPTLPNKPLIAKYCDMGGKLICFSSDAHKIVRMGENYDIAASLVLEFGIKNWTVVENKQIVQVKI